jgi:predicted Zn-dependent peptidase
MGKNDPASLCKYGTIEGAQRTTTETTAAAYYELLRTARIEISFTGSGEWEDALDIFGDAFAPRGDDMSEFVLPRIRERADQITEHTDTFDVVQSKLVMGFRTGARPTLTEQSAIRLAVAIFGGTPSSKLFLNVREKLSLCYYCSARYDRAGAVMLVDSGVESENIIPAREEILRQLDDLKRGDFSDETMQNTRLQMVNALRGVSDSAGAIEDWYLNRILIGEMSTPEQEIELLEATTREEIIEAANRITLDTVYLLTAQEGGEA